jgi:hypothetical protein
LAQDHGGDFLSKRKVGVTSNRSGSGEKMNHAFRLRMNLLKPRRRVGARCTRRWKCEQAAVPGQLADDEASYLGGARNQVGRRKIGKVFD